MSILSKTQAADQEITQIVLNCPTQTPDSEALCQALEDSLQKSAPDYTIRRGTGPANSGDLAITLHMLKSSSQVLEGYLEWHTASELPHKGPPVTFGVDDATISPDTFLTFTSGLIKLSDLPFK